MYFTFSVNQSKCLGASAIPEAHEGQDLSFAFREWKLLLFFNLKKKKKVMEPPTTHTHIHITYTYTYTYSNTYTHTHTPAHKISSSFLFFFFFSFFQTLFFFFLNYSPNLSSPQRRLQQWFCLHLLILKNIT